MFGTSSPGIISYSQWFRRNVNFDLLIFDYFDRILSLHKKKKSGRRICSLVVSANKRPRPVTSNMVPFQMIRGEIDTVVIRSIIQDSIYPVVIVPGGSIRPEELRVIVGISEPSHPGVAHIQSSHKLVLCGGVKRSQVSLVIGQVIISHGWIGHCSPVPQYNTLGLLPSSSTARNACNIFPQIQTSRSDTLEFT